MLNMSNILFKFYAAIDRTYKFFGYPSFIRKKNAHVETNSWNKPIVYICNFLLPICRNDPIFGCDRLTWRDARERMYDIY